MTTPEKLKFRAKGNAKVPDFEQAERQRMAFIGRKHVVIDAKTMGWGPSGEDHEVPYRAEYVEACADGDLYPADEATAAVCDAWAKAHPDCKKAWPKGVVFDPLLGEKRPQEPPPTEPDSAPALATDALPTEFPSEERGTTPDAPSDH